MYLTSIQCIISPCKIKHEKAGNKRIFMETLSLSGAGRGKARLEYSCYAVLGSMAFFIGVAPLFGKYYSTLPEILRTVILILPLHAALFLSVIVPALLMDRDISLAEKLGFGEMTLKSSLEAAGAGVLAFPLLMLVTIGFARLLSIFGIDANVQPVVDLMADSGDVSFFIMVFSAVFLAPFTEELVFRHVIFSRFVPVFGVWSAAAISAVFFTAVHYTLLQFPAIMILGLLLQFVYVRSKSVIGAMIFHGVYNACAVSFLVYGRYSGAF